jgi:hypothetical protein
LGVVEGAARIFGQTTGVATLADTLILSSLGILQVLTDTEDHASSVPAGHSHRRTGGQRRVAVAH